VEQPTKFELSVNLKTAKNNRARSAAVLARARHQPVLDAAAPGRARAARPRSAGFTFLQLLVHLPVVLFLLWALAYTLPYHPPVVPS
jgi:hypothetical protein